MQHHFDVEIAERYGMLEAILLNHFEFWITKNKANDRNFHDGYYWTYNSTRALQEMFPYVSQRKIQNALKHLIEEDIIQTGNYNQSSYDRTLWYAFTEKGSSIMQKREMEHTEKGNPNSEKVKPIPYNNHIKETDNNTDNIYIDYKSIVDYLNKRTGRHYRHDTPETRRLIDARVNQNKATVFDFYEVIDKKCSQWLNDDKFKNCLRPQTLFGTKFDAYLNEESVIPDYIGYLPPEEIKKSG